MAEAGKQRKIASERERERGFVCVRDRERERERERERKKFLRNNKLNATKV